MKVIIAGGRNIDELHIVQQAVRMSGFAISLEVSGGAPGADTLGETVAWGLRVPVKRYPAEWNKYGKGAGMVRNEEMAKNAQALVAIWDGASRGTKHMIHIATYYGLEVYVHRVVHDGLGWFHKPVVEDGL